MSFYALHDGGRGRRLLDRRHGAGLHRSRSLSLAPGVSGGFDRSPRLVRTPIRAGFLRDRLLADDQARLLDDSARETNHPPQTPLGSRFDVARASNANGLRSAGLLDSRRQQAQPPGAGGGNGGVLGRVNDFAARAARQGGGGAAANLLNRANLGNRQNGDSGPRPPPYQTRGAGGTGGTSNPIGRRPSTMSERGAAPSEMEGLMSGPRSAVAGRGGAGAAGAAGNNPEGGGQGDLGAAEKGMSRAGEPRAGAPPPPGGGGAGAAPRADGEQRGRFGEGFRRHRKKISLGCCCVILLVIIVVAIVFGVQAARRSSIESSSSDVPAQDAADAPLPGDGEKHGGDLTWYDVEAGIGACGWTNNNNEAVCAISHATYDAANVDSNQNNNPLCGRKMRIEHGGKTLDVKVVDRCEGCKPTDVDLSPGAFKELADMGAGRIDGTWAWLD